MADITYTRTFQHSDWIDNTDIVQAGGPRGFNQQFHDIESEVDKLSTVVGSVNDGLNRIQRLTFILSQGAVTVSPNSASPEFSVDLYDRTGLPANVEKIYFPVLLPTGNAVPVISTFQYRPQPGNKMDVKVIFFNPSPAPAQFAFRILGLTVQ